MSIISQRSMEGKLFSEQELNENYGLQKIGHTSQSIACVDLIGKIFFFRRQDTNLLSYAGDENSPEAIAEFEDFGMRLNTCCGNVDDCQFCR